MDQQLPRNLWPFGNSEGIFGEIIYLSQGVKVPALTAGTSPLEKTGTEGLIILGGKLVGPASTQPLPMQQGDLVSLGPETACNPADPERVSVGWSAVGRKEGRENMPAARNCLETTECSWRKD